MGGTTTPLPQTQVGNHSFRATGITAYLANGGTPPRTVGSATAADFYGADETACFGGDRRCGRRWWDRSDPSPGRLVLVDPDGLAPAARQRCSWALTPAKRGPKSAARNPLAAELVQARRESFRAPSRRGILAGMGTRPRSTADDPMTRGNMRADGVRSLDVSCLTVPPPGDLECRPVARSRASAIVRPAHGVHPVWYGADARPNWQEQPQRESLTGVQWR
jgi:hypothetical protein